MEESKLAPSTTVAVTKFREKVDSFTIKDMLDLPEAASEIQKEHECEKVPFDKVFATSYQDAFKDWVDPIFRSPGDTRPTEFNLPDAKTAEGVYEVSWDAAGREGDGFVYSVAVRRESPWMWSEHVREQKFRDKFEHVGRSPLADLYAMYALRMGVPESTVARNITRVIKSLALVAITGHDPDFAIESTPCSAPDPLMPIFRLDPSWPLSYRGLSPLCLPSRRAPGSIYGCGLPPPEVI
jgi:hypothetical protein